MRTIGAVFYILGFLVAGVMFMVIGAEFNKDDEASNDDLRTYFWIYAVSLFFAAIGTILENGDRFCGEEEQKNVDYFGGLFQLVAVFAWAGFGIGLAHFFEDEQYFTQGTNPRNAFVNTESADERANLSWLSGVAAIVYMVGSVLSMRQLLCCEGFSCTMSVAVNIANIFLCLILVIFWFLFADRINVFDSFLDPNLILEDPNKISTYSYLIGVVYIIIGLVGALKIFEFCGNCFGGKGYGKKPSYGPKPGYKPKPSYGEQPRPSYGQQPEYGRPQPQY